MERIGIAFTGGLTPPEVVECVIYAEELGYESAWVAEGLGGDQFSILTASAVATKTILLGTSISSVFVRWAPWATWLAASWAYSGVHQVRRAPWAISPQISSILGNTAAT